MALVFSAIAPHPPILIPDIGKDKLSELISTVDAMKEMEGDLYVTQPDVIFIISPHSPITPEAYSLNLANEFSSNLEEFGCEKKYKFKCEVELISKIKEEADDAKMPVNIISSPVLDHGVSVPLYYLTQHLPNVKIVPISFSLLDYKNHYRFGILLRKIINHSNKRIAIIASSDLSHSSSVDNKEDGKSFDHLLVRLLEENKIKDVLNIEPGLIEKSGECGFRSLVVLLGSLEGLSYKFKKLSYEGPLGIGYLVAEFALS